MTGRADTALRILVTGGGTGGHTYPALAIIRALQDRYAGVGQQVQVLWVGVRDGLEARVAADEQIAFHAVTTGKLRRSPNRRELAANLTDAFRIPVGIGQALRVVARFRPDVVVSTGGYAAVPTGIAGWLLRRRVVMHEQTLGVGLANRILARVADRVLLSHDTSLSHLPRRARHRAAVTGNPIRPMAGDRGLAALSLSAQLPLVLVTGGAQGARQINQMLATVLPELLDRCQVVHQTGAGGLDTMRAVAAELDPALAGRYRPVAYLSDELADVLAAADLVIARAGAGTVAELTAVGKAMVLIPLIPTDGDEQRRTARHLSDHGAAVMLAGADATAPRLGETVLGLLANPDRRKAMAANAARLGHRDAADRVVDELVALLRHPGLADAPTQR